MSDFQTQRINMVECQIQTNDVTDRRILAAMKEIPRHEFVPVSVRPLSYMDKPIEVHAQLGDLPSRMILRPMVFAKLVELARVEAGDIVLDVGCATGYSTAILAQLAESVVGLEADQSLAERATATFSELGVDNAAVVTGPLNEGQESQGPFDVIVFEGRIPEVPESFRDQLKENGRLVAITGDGPMGRAVRYGRHGEGWGKFKGFDASAGALPGFEKAPTFVF